MNSDEKFILLTALDKKFTELMPAYDFIMRNLKVNEKKLQKEKDNERIKAIEEHIHEAETIFKELCFRYPSLEYPKQLKDLYFQEGLQNKIINDDGSINISRFFRHPDFKRQLITELIDYANEKGLTEQFNLPRGNHQK